MSEVPYTSWAAYRNNPFEKDRLSYAVRAHTDPSRYEGMAGTINLANFNWGAFDLVVIDESHNFRNEGRDRTDETGGIIRRSRYNRLLEEVVKDGVRTKVLMLSATPVNTSLRDLRNQLYLMTEKRRDAFREALGIGDIQTVFGVAQRRFMQWEQERRAGKKADKNNLIERLGADFLALLDAVTIARSRDHVRRFYPKVMEEIGGFPQRARPENLHPPTDSEGELSYDDLHERIGSFRLAVHALNMVTSIAAKLLGIPQVGEIVAAILKTATNTAEQLTSADDLREKVEAELKERNGKPIIVVLDDVDRLSVSEIRDVFKLVRLTASFPNLIYIVACDRFRVEQALSEQGLPVRDYLEKILQLPFDLPKIPRHKLREQVDASIKRIRADVENSGPSDNEAWTYIYAGIVRPLVRNMRDVRRYAAAVRGTVIGLDGQVALADVLGLEAVRLFLPDVFKRLPDAIDALTVASVAQENKRKHDELRQKHVDGSTEREDPTEYNERLVERIDELIKAGGTGKGVARAMVNCLFPSGRIYLDSYNEDLHLPMGEQYSERRVFHEHILRLYLEHVVNDDVLARNDAERAFERMADRVKLETLIRSLDPARWLDVILHLENFGNQFRPEHVEPGIVGLLNLLPETPKRSCIYPLDDCRTAVMNITDRLLSVLGYDADIKAAVRRILPRVTSLSSRVELVLRVGHREKFGGKLVSEEAAVELEKMLRDEIRAASADDLAGERDLGRILVLAKRGADPSGDPLDIPDSPKLTFAILRALAIKVTGASDNRTRLDRAFLIDLYGDEATLKARIESLNAQFEALKPWIESLPMPLDDAERLLELANEHL